MLIVHIGLSTFPMWVMLLAEKLHIILFAGYTDSKLLNVIKNLGNQAFSFSIAASLQNFANECLKNSSKLF